MKSKEILKEIKEMTPVQLEAKIKELKEELFHLRFQHAINQLDNPHKMEDVKKEIARTMTILHQKNTQGAGR